MILKLGMKHQGEELYKVYINHDLGMTLTYFIYPSSQVSVYRTIGPFAFCSVGPMQRFVTLKHFSKRSKYRHHFDFLCSLTMAGCFLRGSSEER